jgi:sec-independent protein translocase protein TatA
MGLPNIGPLELIIILAIALLIVGPGRLPEMGSAIGRTIREFRKASTDVGEATRVDTPPKQLPPNTLSEAAAPNVATASAAPAQAAGDDALAPAGTPSGVKSSGDPA